MKKFHFVFLLFMFKMAAQDRPKLVVGIVVDQMKPEYLTRFSNDFSNDGFKRLTKKGYVYQNVHYNYVPTYTAPGHASIYTGATPAQHGILANDWYSKSLKRKLYCTDDDAVKTIGDGSKEEGEMSPNNLLTTTITDELRLATNFKGKVISMSIKDRGAILPGGHFANQAYWLSNTGSFISSSFYGDSLPHWVNQFNAQKKYMTYIESGWDLLMPKEKYKVSLSDNNPYEGLLFTAQEPVFPYNLNEMYESNGAKIIKETPFGNDILADFAMQAITNEQLGADEITDFLAVSFSSTDYIGHHFGPRSLEIQDTYIRLDRTIANLINFLDNKVGKGNYLLFLTADHGGAENTNYLKDNKYNVNNVTPQSIRVGLKEFSIKKYGIDFVENYSNYNLFLNTQLIENQKLNYFQVVQSFKNYLVEQPYVARAYTQAEILLPSITDYYLQMIAKGYNPSENGDLVILDKPACIEYGATGTSHGTAYTYDTHVPLIFYGWKVRAGTSFAKKTITQIVPTLALKLQLPFPNASDLHPLKEILNEKQLYY